MTIKKKKRVLYLATFDPTVSATGTATRGKLFLRFFCEHYETHLVHMREKHDDGKDESLIKSLAGKITIDFTPLDYFLFSRKLYGAAKETLQRGSFDFIFADFEKAGLYAYFLSKKYRIPYIYSSHNVEYLRYINVAKRNLLRYPLMPYLYAAEKIACQNALFTVAISEKDAKTFKAWVSEDKVLAIPCTFDETVFNPFYDETSKVGAPIVLLVGNYRNPGNREGAYLLYEKIVPDVIDKHPGTIFRCIGRDFPPDIQHPNIEVLGFVEDLLSEYKRAALIIVPITIGGGIKIKTIEGLACGKFVISTSKGVEGIDISGMENLEVVPIEKFSDCINRVISNPIPRTTKNWEKIKNGYGTRQQLSVVRHKLENLL